MSRQYDRRDFLRLGVTAGAGLALHGTSVADDEEPRKTSPAKTKAPPIDRVRIAMVGVGGRGHHLVELLLGLEGVEIRAVCDIVEERVAKAQQLVKKAGQAKPRGYSRGDTDFVRLCEQEDVDLIVAATPWRWHVPVCVAAMEAGKHAATEVPAAVTIDECWQLVETAEKTRKHCVMLENCCYGRTEMIVLNMVRQGVLGELIHAEAGYLHDARDHLSQQGEVSWRLENLIRRNGNLYPTHGLGPVAQCMNIDRGDRFDYLVSMSSKSRGLKLRYKEKYGPDHPRTTQKYALGDVNVSLIHTVNGATMTLVFDTQLPRPYSRINIVQGTRGIVQGYPERIYIDGRSPRHDWETLDKYYAEYDHPLWKALRERAEGKGHGGMDYMMLYRLVKCLRTGAPPDMDVYDAASWSVVSALSEQSVANRSQPVDFPDFTRGKWKTNPPLGIVGA